MTGSEHSEPAVDATASTVTRLELTEAGKDTKVWRVELHPAHLTLADAPEAQPFVVLRGELMKSAVLVEPMKILAVQKPCKVNLKLTADDARALAEWIGLPVLARFYLRRRYGWTLPVAIIWFIGAVPLQGDPAAGIEAHPFDPIALVFGLVLVAGWALAKWRPHPGLFLLDSLWFLGLSAHLTHSVTQGRSAGWLVLVLFFLRFIWTGVGHFRRFREVKLH